MRARDESPLLAHADRQVARLLRRDQPPAARRGAPSDDAQIDAALSGGRLAAARHLATTLGISAGELALRAVAVGRVDLARQQADLVLSADPTDGDAWVALVAAADLSRDEPELATALLRLDDHPVPPGPLGTQLLEELLERRVGSEAAAAWASGRAATGRSSPTESSASPE